MKIKDEKINDHYQFIFTFKYMYNKKRVHQHMPVNQTISFKFSLVPDGKPQI